MSAPSPPASLAPSAPVSPPITPATATWVGLLGLASAMGVGRFAFTPMLPLMQGHGQLDLSSGARLAAANFLGYLVGALACTLRPPALVQSARWGLVAVALLTLAMGLTTDLDLWWWLRAAAGAASAFVVVGVSGWALPLLAGTPQIWRPGALYGGVGLGIATAGLVCWWALWQDAAPAPVWLGLGLLSSSVALLAWQQLRVRPVDRPPRRAGEPAQAPSASSAGAVPPAATAAAAPRASLHARLSLVGCYALLGFGYSVPATFLPAMARTLLADPLRYGLVWPVFGVAAAASTLLAAAMARRVAPRRLWAGAHVTMALGVLAPLAWPGMGGLLLAALAVGGTFMVATMVGLQETRRLAGHQPARLLAAMTTAFALGQCAGPWSVALAARQPGTLLGAPVALAVPSLLASVLLLFGAALLRRPAPSQPASGVL